MELTSWLQTLAEVAVAMAGFSAVITAFAYRGGAVEPMMANRLFSIVSISLLVALLTILPEILDRLGVGMRASLRLSALVALVSQGFLFRAVIRGFRRIEGYRAQVSGFGLWSAYTFIGISLVASAVLASGLMVGSEAGLFLTMLTSLLAVAAMRFTGFATVISSRSIEADDA